MSQNILLVNAQNYFKERFIEECSKKKFSVTSINLYECIIHTKNSVSVYYKNTILSLSDFDFIFTKTINKNYSYASLFYEIFTHLKIPHTDHLYIHNNKNNKFTQTLKLVQNGFNCPESFIFTKTAILEHFDFIVSTLGFPLVLKGIGDRSTAVWKIGSADEFTKKIDELNLKVFIAQKYILNTYDIRVLLYKNNIIGSIKRPTPNFYPKVVKGDIIAETIELTEEEQYLAIESAKLLEVDFAGVDFVRSNNKIYFYEVNESPSFKGFEKITKIDVVGNLVELIAFD